MAKRIPKRHQNKPKQLIRTRLKREDRVRIIAGKDKGKEGRILEIDKLRGTVVVEGQNMIKRHTKPNPAKQIKGGIAEREAPIAISNVMILTSGGVPTRIGMRVDGEGSTVRRVRVARKNDETLETKSSS